MTKLGTSADNQPDRPVNRELSSASNTFKKAERLKHQAGFDFLFDKGKRIDRKSFQVMYSFDYPAKHLSHILMGAFAVPKRNFKKAVTRNLLKRRMRESWRTNNQTLKNLLLEKKRNLVVSIRYKSKEIFDYKLIESEMREIIRLLEGKV